MATVEPTPITKRKGRPVKRISGDDYTVVLDGETYYPHADEWVELRTTQTIEDFALITQLSGAAGDDLTATLATMRTVRDALARRIIACEWTDVRGDLLPSPPTAADLDRLDLNEIAWLFRGGKSAADLIAEQDTEAKNGSAPSTAT